MLIFGEKLVLNFLIFFSKIFLNKMIKNVYFWIFLGKNLKSSRQFYNCKIVALIEDFDFFEVIFKTRHFRSFYEKKENQNFLHQFFAKTFSKKNSNFYHFRSSKCPTLVPMSPKMLTHHARSCDESCLVY